MLSERRANIMNIRQLVTSNVCSSVRSSLLNTVMLDGGSLLIGVRQSVVLQLAPHSFRFNII